MDPAATIAWAEQALEARSPWREILERLAALSADELPADLKTRFLIARGVAENRRGDASAALRDLLSAQAILSTTGDRERLSDVAREIGVVHAWRGAGREAGFAFVRALAEAASSSSREHVARAIVEAARANVEIGRPQDAATLLQLALQDADVLTLGERGRAEVMLIKALNDADQFDAAEERLKTLDIAALRPREATLARIENVRIMLQRGKVAEAKRNLEDLAQSLPADPNAFERADYLAILCESHLAARDGASALKALDELIPKVEGDDLGAPLIAALDQKARALDLLQRHQEAADSAADALRRAAARHLQREADAMREALVLRGEKARALSGLARGRIDSRFVRSAFVGQGGFGKVVRAFDLETGEEVALKQLRMSNLADADLRRRMFDSAEREVQAAKSIAHPGVARVIGLFYEPDGDVFVASAFVHGRTLRQVMNDTSGRSDKVAVVAQIANALAASHERGVVHGDVKPENVILNEAEVPVLVDFGCATVARQRSLGPPGYTAEYAAPEQKRRLLNRVGPEADVFALGGIAVELLSGKRPPPVSPYAFVPGYLRRAELARELSRCGVSGELARLIAAALSPWRRLRPTAAALARALTREA
jgi:hypothetical protein